jgi:hypothetical protein
MLRSIVALKDHSVQAEDGPIGTVKDFYFDDSNWAIRYLVVDPGTWLSRQNVLIAPSALGQPDWEECCFPVKLSQAEVKESPEINTNQPISRQQEIEVLNHYRWPIYWMPGNLLTAQETRTALEQSQKEDNTRSYVRSANEVMGYRIRARDGEVGHVEDFIVDDQRWEINYLVIDTRNWLPGRKVLV